MNKRIACRGLWLTWLLVLLVGETGVAAEQIPLPSDAGTPAPPIQAMIGRQAVSVQMFHSRRSIEELRAFYLEELPKQGWRIEELPWMAAIDGRIKKLDEIRTQLETVEREHASDQAAIKALHEKPEFQKLQAFLNDENIQKVRERATRMLHAVRRHKGEPSKHVLLSMSPTSNGTGVDVNQWKGDWPPTPQAQKKEGELDHAEAEKTPGWPTTNVCCTGEAVPFSERKLPLSIPDYPNARMVTAGASVVGGMTSAMYMSPDVLSDIENFYRSHMAYNGWVARKDDASRSKLPDALAKNVQAAQMSFKKGSEHCGVTLTAWVGPQKPGDKKDQTVIVVTYLDGEQFRKDAQATRRKRTH